MAVRSFVGFVADFPLDDGEEPPGEGLARYIASRLKTAGLAVSDIRVREGWAWEFQTSEGKLVVETIVGLVGDMDTDPPRQWLITNECNPGLLKRLFGGSEVETSRDHLLRKVCEEIHQVMTEDSRFSHIVWYNSETFDEPGDEPGDSP